MGPQSFFCVLHMKKKCLIKRSRGEGRPRRPEGFVALYVCGHGHVCMSGYKTPKILLYHEKRLDRMHSAMGQVYRKVYDNILIMFVPDRVNE